MGDIIRSFSRRRIVVATLCLLGVLDLGRSMFARIGYAEPAEPWQMAPYEAMSWPPGEANASTDSPGQQVYEKRCAICHGVNGRGDGPAAPSLIPRPRDFTVGEYKYKSTAPDEDASDDDLRHTIEYGLAASAMPYWKDILSQEEIDEVIKYIRAFSLFGAPESDPVSLNVTTRVDATAASLARGGLLFEKSCSECHESDGRGDVRPAERIDDYPVPTRDLTAPWTFRGGSEASDIWMRISTGMRPGPMPDYMDALSDAERWDIANYVKSLQRVAPWEAKGELQGPGHHEDLVKRGEYLVHAEMCGLCHTQVNKDMIYSGDEYYLAGGMGVPVYPHGVYVSRNLTPDVETGIGSWSIAEIAHAIRNGRTPERLLFFFDMPWMLLHTLSEDDALAIASFLKSRKPVTNRIPMPLHYGVVETIAAKVAYSSGLPPMGNPTRLTFKAGNYGQTAPHDCHWTGHRLS
jgi:mono/diheme cytochrome c family protein